LGQRYPMNERSEWKAIRRSSAENTDLNQRDLEEMGQVQGDSLDFAELVMALEEKYKKKLPL
jgi:acyl carrier protein